MTESLPLTKEEEFLGEPIKDVSSINGIVTSIIVKDKDTSFDVMNEIKMNNEYRVHVNKPKVVLEEDYISFLRGPETDCPLLELNKCSDGSVIKKTINTGYVFK